MTDLKRRVLFPLASLLIGLVLSLVLAEILLRVAGLAPTSSLTSVTTNEFERIPGIWSPGQTVTQQDIKTLPYTVGINWAGYRGRKFEQEKKPGELRVLVTGDSFTFGNYVNDDETMPSQLEQRLSQTCRARPVTVLNAALGGSTILGQAELIRRGLKLKPDLVVLVFHGNDIDDLNAPIWEAMAHNRKLKDRFVMRVFWPMLRNTALWNLGLRLRGMMRVADGRQMVPGTTTAEADPATAKRQDTYRDKLRDLATMLNDARQPFVFVTYPGHWALKGKQPYQGTIAWAAAVGKSSGMPTLDLLPILRSKLSKDIDKGFLLPHDGHPSKLGHGIAAEAVSKFLLDQPAVAAACK